MFYGKFLEMPLSKTTQKFLGLNELSSNQEIIKAVAANQLKTAKSLAEKFGLLSYDGIKLKRNRERQELEEKLRFLNLKVPWSKD